MENLISICVITSPAPSNPSLVLIESFLRSLIFLPELIDCPIIVICDGYQVTDKTRYKKGRVDTGVACLYEEYKQNLVVFVESLNAKRRATAPHQCHCLDKHYGFAQAVKVGLSLCNTKYCLISQHDRLFCFEYTKIHRLIDIMENQSNVRYIGFPCINNNTHNMVVHTKYKLCCLNEQDVVIYVEGDEFLQPLIFWYDSQHLCHVQRYLEIYQPYRNIPSEFKSLYGKEILNEMILRKGDFIEDRFGQNQLKSLVRLISLHCDDELIKRAFRWYGSYLVWIPMKTASTDTFLPDKIVNSFTDCSNESTAINLSGDPSSFPSLNEASFESNIFCKYPSLQYHAIPMIQHMRGRQLDLDQEERYKTLRAERALVKVDQPSKPILPGNETYESFLIFDTSNTQSE